FQSPNFADPAGPPVPLLLFLVPRQTPAAALDAEALRGVAAGLHEHVYGNDPGDPLYELTLPPDCRPELRPVADLAALTGAGRAGRGGHDDRARRNRCDFVLALRRGPQPSGNLPNNFLTEWWFSRIQ